LGKGGANMKAHPNFSHETLKRLKSLLLEDALPKGREKPIVISTIEMPAETLVSEPEPLSAISYRSDKPKKVFRPDEACIMCGAVGGGGCEHCP